MLPEELGSGAGSVSLRVARHTIGATKTDNSTDHTFTFVLRLAAMAKDLPTRGSAGPRGHVQWGGMRQRESRPICRRGQPPHDLRTTGAAVTPRREERSTATTIAAAASYAESQITNTAIAHAKDPVLMARAMKAGVEAGRMAYLAGRMGKRMYADPSSPLAGLI